MKNIYFINGSPRGKEATSLHFLKELNNYMDKDKNIIHFFNLKANNNANDFQDYFNKIENANAIIISFPLYVYCLPGILINFLEECYLFFRINDKLKNNIRVYVIVNCGVQEPKKNNEAIRVIKNFCTRLNLNWRFAISIGMGSFFVSIKDNPYMKENNLNISNALQDISKDIENEAESKKENIFIKPKVLESKSLDVANMMWIKIAEENGLNEEDLYKKPYISSNL